MFAPAPVVEGPTRTALPYGLFSVLTPRPETADGGKWQNGITWESLTCAPASGIGEPECEPDSTIGLPKNFAEGILVGEASPFTIYGTFKCSPGGRTIQEAQNLATRHLLTREEARVEQALATGDLGNTPNFTEAEVIVEGAFFDQGIGALEQFAAQEYGSQAVIHLPREAAQVAAYHGVTFNGGVARTALGTPVVFGSGYTGASPTGDRAPLGSGNVWGYVTPALVGYRSEIIYPTNRLGDLLDRASNDLYSIAERTYVIGWDECGVGAANIVWNS